MSSAMPMHDVLNEWYLIKLLLRLYIGNYCRLAVCRRHFEASYVELYDYYGKSKLKVFVEKDDKYGCSRNLISLFNRHISSENSPLNKWIRVNLEFLLIIRSITLDINYGITGNSKLYPTAKKYTIKSATHVGNYTNLWFKTMI